MAWYRPFTWMPLGPATTCLLSGGTWKLTTAKMSFLTDILGSGQVQTMAIERALPDIAWAVAWSEDGTFARFDHLLFSAPVPIPEPSVASLASLAALLSAAASRVRRGRRGG